MNIQPSQIWYIILLGERDSMLATNIPSESMIHPMLSYIGDLPQHMIHFVYGCEYYEESLRKGLQIGYKTVFFYPDSISTIDTVPIDVTDVRVFLYCTEDEKIRKHYCSFITPLIGEHSLSIVSKGTKKIGNISGIVADSGKDVWDWFYRYSWAHYNIEANRYPYSVPYFTNKGFYDIANFFAPTRVNTQIFNAILGNWGYSIRNSDNEGFEKPAESSKSALEDKYSFARQNILLDQIIKIHAIENAVVERVEEKQDFIDQFFPPLIIAAPYNSAEMRRPIDAQKIKNVKEKENAEIFNAAMNYNYTKNYVIDVSVKDIQANPGLFILIQRQFVSSRMNFFDMVGQLHASIRFSPYVRFPILGKNINTELAFVGIKNVKNLVKSRKASQSIRKVMERIGKKIASCAISPTFFKMINKRPSQIVAMTDLPIEWVMNNGVPLAFTHDVCRLPETPLPSLLAQYVESTVTPYIIPTDIITKTLVVFGNNEPEFVRHQRCVLDLADELGFRTKTCLSIKELEDTIKNVRPEFLIIDAHGDVDEKTHQSFLYIGDDKLTGDIVVTKHLSSRLVFLSACNTFTTCNTISTIANAFFQAGAAAVTTSYMPVYVAESTILYARILKLLSVAASTPVHKNWLAFMSHILRTSYIHSLMTEAERDGFAKINSSDLELLSKLSALSMFFGNRKNIYKQLNETSLAKKMGVNFQYVIPHYLMYSTVGRADLIRFQCYLNERLPDIAVKI